MRGARHALAVALLLAFAPGAASALTIPDKPLARVNDYAGALSGAARERIERQIADGTAGRSNQVAVAIFPSLDGESIEDVSIRLAEKWKIGGKGTDDGVLVTLFLADHKLRIEVGYGVEGALPDARAGRIISEVMAPRLRQNDTEGALREGVAAILEAIHGEGKAVAAPPVGDFGRAPPPPDWRAVLVVAGIFVVLLVLWARFRPRSGYSTGSNGWASQAGWSLFWNVIFSLLFDGRGRGGGGGGGGWSGGGGGGFSGGGGGFGGGGASGSW